MAAALNINGLPCCPQQSWLMRSSKCIRSVRTRVLAPRPGRVQRCARVTTEAAARNSGDDSSGRNRIGRSMDDNASTDEPWWKALFGMQKRQNVQPDKKKPAGNSLNGKYNVQRPIAAGKSGTVNRSAADQAGRPNKASAQPRRRMSATSKPSQRQKRTTGSTRSLAGEPVVDDGADSFWFDNLYTYWWQEESDRPVLRRDADDSTDNSDATEGGGWFGGLLVGSSASREVAAADATETTSGWSFGGHSTSHDPTSSSSNADTSSSYSIQDTSSHSSSWDSSSHPSTNDSSSYDTSSYDTGSYDAGSYDSGGGNCGGDAGGD